jgi:hypothetical protein
MSARPDEHEAKDLLFLSPAIPRSVALPGEPEQQNHSNAKFWERPDTIFVMKNQESEIEDSPKRKRGRAAT